MKLNVPMFIEFFILASECETIDNGSNSHSSQPPNICQARSPGSPSILSDRGYDSSSVGQANHQSLNSSNPERR